MTGAARVLHIGAGADLDLPACLEAGAQSVTLTQADPDLAADLRGLAAPYPQISVIEAAVSAGPRPRAFYRASLPDLSSFRAPTALKKLFPGLKILSRDIVQPANPVTLARGLAGEGPAALVIEAPGEALGILRALEAAGLLTVFDTVRLREGLRPLYEGAPAAAAIADFLTGAGYEAAFDPEPADPDRPWLTARLDRAALEAAQLRADLDTARAALEAERAEAEAARAKAAAAEAGAQAARAQATEAAEVRAGLEAARQTAGAEADEARAGAEALRRDLEAAQKTIAAARTELEAAHTRAAEAGAEAEALRAQKQTGGAAEQDLAEARRLLALREGDLAEIQGRYAALYEENQSLTGLLRDLAGALGATPGPTKTKAGGGSGKTTRKPKSKSKSKPKSKSGGGGDG